MNVKIMNLIFGVCCLSGVFMCLSCRKTDVGPSSRKEAGTSSTSVTNRYMPPELPVIYQSADDRLQFLRTHYWDAFQFNDTVNFGSRASYAEQAFADFLVLFAPGFTASDASCEAIKLLVEKASASEISFSFFIGLAEKYLYNPNSPMRDEELFICVLKHAEHSPRMVEGEKERFRYLLDMALKNRRGTRAADFVYTLKDGKQGRMSAVKAKYTLLFFNNPDCTDCKRTKEILSKLELARERLTILALYTEDDLEFWKKADYPEDWINAYDKNCKLTEQNRYDLKAMPTLYLLDERKNVLLKDVTVEVLLEYLEKVL